MTKQLAAVLGTGIDNAHMAFDSDCFSQAMASTRR